MHKWLLTLAPKHWLWRAVPMLLHSSLFKPLLLDHAVANELHSIFQRKWYLTNPVLLQDPRTSNAVINIHSRGNGQPGLFLDTKFQQYLPITVPIRTKHVYVRIISGATITNNRTPGSWESIKCLYCGDVGVEEQQEAIRELLRPETPLWTRRF